MQMYINNNNNDNNANKWAHLCWMYWKHSSNNPRYRYWDDTSLISKYWHLNGWQYQSQIHKAKNKLVLSRVLCQKMAGPQGDITHCRTLICQSMMTLTFWNFLLPLPLKICIGTQSGKRGTDNRKSPIIIMRKCMFYLFIISHGTPW